MNYVLDTNVLVAAVRSPGGASAEILRRVLTGQIGALCSVPLFMEY
jgi:predicted nucleic acid-binding protein